MLVLGICLFILGLMVNIVGNGMDKKWLKVAGFIVLDIGCFCIGMGIRC